MAVTWFSAAQVRLLLTKTEDIPALKPTTFISRQIYLYTFACLVTASGGRLLVFGSWITGLCCCFENRLDLIIIFPLGHLEGGAPHVTTLMEWLTPAYLWRKVKKRDEMMISTNADEAAGVVLTLQPYWQVAYSWWNRRNEPGHLLLGRKKPFVWCLLARQPPVCRRCVDKTFIS